LTPRPYRPGPPEQLYRPHRRFPLLQPRRGRQHLPDGRFLLPSYRGHPYAVIPHRSSRPPNKITISRRRNLAVIFGRRQCRRQMQPAPPGTGRRPGVLTFPQMLQPVQPVGWELPWLAGGGADGAIGSIRGMGSGPTSVWARKIVPFLSSSLAMLRANFL